MLAKAIPLHSGAASNRVPVRLSAILAEIRVSNTATKATFNDPITISLIGIGNPSSAPVPSR
jgi:hypothetical protein